MKAPPLGLAAVALLAAGAGSGAQELKNWFADPFFRLTSAVAHCQEPAGPRITQAERAAQSHHRAEAGTTCWLAQDADCQRPSAYVYDRDIAEAIRSAALSKPSALAGTTLWVTVQGRVVYLEGCVSRASQAAAVEALVRRLPHVRQAVAIVTTDPAAVPPYRRLAP